jgi:hypothetical protein
VIVLIFRNSLKAVTVAVSSEVPSSFSSLVALLSVISWQQNRRCSNQAVDLRGKGEARTTATRETGDAGQVSAMNRQVHQIAACVTVKMQHWLQQNATTLTPDADVGENETRTPNRTLVQTR